MSKNNRNKFIYDDELDIPDIPAMGWLVILAVAMLVICATIWFYTREVVKETREEKQASVQLNEEQKEYVAFFKRHGSPEPEAMAMAVSAVKAKNRPMLAAISIVESGGDPKAVGDSGDSIGAFQVQPKHWGPVSASPVQQALQAERVLEELLSSRRSLRSGLASYNGGVRPPKRSYRYADRIMRIARGI